MLRIYHCSCGSNFRIDSKLTHIVERTQVRNIRINTYLLCTDRSQQLSRQAVTHFQVPDTQIAYVVQPKVTILIVIAEFTFTDGRITSRYPFTIRIIQVGTMPTVFQQINRRVSVAMICIGQLIVLSPSLHSTTGKVDIQVNALPLQTNITTK